MEICDIQLENNKVVVTFCETETQEDQMELKLSLDDLKKLHYFYITQTTLK